MCDYTQKAVAYQGNQALVLSPADKMDNKKLLEEKIKTAHMNVEILSELAYFAQGLEDRGKDELANNIRTIALYRV